MHLGSMKQEFAQRMVAQVNELHPDAILFTGDLQNMRPQELVRHAPTLVHLHPVDGIFSVLGNHDYADYVKTATAEQKRDMERLTRSFEASLNWDLLLNERRILRRGADSIVIAGTENDGRPPFPCKADYRKALHGISPKSFVIMMQHDPSAHTATMHSATNAERTHPRRTVVALRLATHKSCQQRGCRTV